MRHKYIMIAAMAAIPLLLAAQPANASRGDYCREFTKSIRIGGNLESGYGRACLQPDGSWQIVATSGSLHPREIFPDDIHRRIVYRDVYYAPPPRYSYPRVNYYYYDRHPGRHYGHHKKDWHHKHGRDWDRHDRDDRRGRDRGRH